ncbi:amine oxidase [Methyloglobulus morosus KoM1]|uniref:Amine oxidase n=1 Tax=Methyloglobulus morosus KoM1 TaxID=1116472 RepID=V5E2E3_9GAMM|nr:NAD(P)/FAD-dependent oxidoreductase [Methyloglobulus morosus]ESS73721.1 amine oxidase [Methyloglobulus morosus KoM1]
MHDTVIVGGGLCGLMLAYTMQREGRPYALFEARPRLGGRILSVQSEATGAALDLGPTWFWPEQQPRLASLITELSLTSFPQNDAGTVLRLDNPDGKLETSEDEALHGGAQRLDGGMASLVNALAEHLPPDSIKLGQVLTAIEEHGDHLVLRFRVGEDWSTIEARRVVLALPPRLVLEQVSFKPTLNENLQQALENTPTWMAAEAKALVAYPKAFWRDAGQSGNGSADHEQAVLGEIFDACDATASKAALGGFVALSPSQRISFQVGLPILVESQLAQFFGKEAQDGELHFQDWATETYTCSKLDEAQPFSQPEYGNPYLQQPYWNHKLYLGSSETARHGGGYLEGALDAAARIYGQFSLAPCLHAPENRRCVIRFSDWVNTYRTDALAFYQRYLNQRLADQQRDQLTQLSLLATVDEIYQKALLVLEELPFVTEVEVVVNGRSDLTPHLLTPFMGFNETLLNAALEFNRSSCAISNFDQEHKPTDEYIDTIRRDLASAWREFALNVNTLLVKRSTSQAATA